MTMILVPARRRSLARRLADALPAFVGLAAPAPRTPRFAPPVHVERIRPGGRRAAEAFADPLL